GQPSDGTVALDRTELDFLGESSPVDGDELTFYTPEGKQRYLAHPRTDAMRQNRALSAAFERGERPIWASVLGVSWPCTSADIKQSYRRKARVLHPDAGGDAAAFAELQAAYESALALLQ
ncbi:MAG TPA: J domain-containing protein, partial [Roseiflexaceae bacterium]|nr:J domain-containing protein [Roseiflexaceae bacterium]